MIQFTKRGKTVERKNTIYDTIMEIKSVPFLIPPLTEIVNFISISY